MKNKIETFKIPYVRNLEGRVNNINPYVIINLHKKMFC